MDNEEYFPYTHGDLIEEQRLIMNDYLGHEMKGHYWEALKKKAMDFEEKKARSLEKYKESVKA
jgi:hypothetical protein